MNLNLLLLALLLLGCRVLPSLPLIMLHNMRCSSYNASLLQFEYCQLNAVRRNYKDISVKIAVYNRPINKAELAVQFMKKSNGYQQFMPELKVDFCSFLQKQNNFVLNRLYKLWLQHSNINHTCPYEEDVLLLDHLHFDDDSFSWIPFPLGDYALYTKWTINGLLQLKADLFYSIVEA